jgi:hypothetical protein
MQAISAGALALVIAADAPDGAITSVPVLTK